MQWPFRSCAVNTDHTSLCAPPTTTITSHAISSSQRQVWRESGIVFGVSMSERSAGNVCGLGLCTSAARSCGSVKQPPGWIREMILQSSYFDV